MRYLIQPSIVVSITFLFGPLSGVLTADEDHQERREQEQRIVISLPSPRVSGNRLLEDAMTYSIPAVQPENKPLSSFEISQLIWAAQGITDPRGYRTAPSGQALYPLEIYIMIGNVMEIPPGIYKYIPSGHSLVLVQQGDARKKISQSFPYRNAIGNSPAVLAVAAVYERTDSVLCWERSLRGVHVEAGASVQNILLEAASLRLTADTYEWFFDNKIKPLLRLQKNEEPVCLIAIGKDVKAQEREK